MPICEADPWRLQYFETVPCPEDVRIPTEDGDAYRWYKPHKWVYNKLSIAESQDIKCAPHGIDPDSYPVFSKPIYNMRGMGSGSRKLKDVESYKKRQRPGHMWMELCQGDHVSTDVAVIKGECVWWRHVTGIPLKKGMFDYWVVEKNQRAELVQYCGSWISQHLKDYTGMINLETIGTRIIEVHLRFADQWPDLYGKNWVDSLVTLYSKGEWNFEDSDRREGYSVVLFGAHGVQYTHPSAEVVETITREDCVTSVQITFHEDKPPEQHSMPPGGFRLAIINGFDLEAQKKLREQLALSFWSTQSLIEAGG